MLSLETPLKELTRVGKTASARLKRLGLETVQDLIFYFPFRYEDYSNLKQIKDLNPDELVTVKGKVELIANRRSRYKRTNLTEALITDETGSVKVIWFNQPFIIKNLKIGDYVYLSGKVDADHLGIQLKSPDYEKVSQNNVHTARLVPFYSLTDGLTQKQIRFLINQSLKSLDQVKDYLPETIIKKHNFLDLQTALKNIHFPENKEILENSRDRLKFDELFLIQLQIQRFRQELDNNQAFKIKFLKKKTQEFVKGLPFELTKDQKKSAWEIIQDLETERPMNRMLQGDVGSGKTIVVALSILNTILNGYKAVLMAPTEILAKQHYQTFLKVFKNKNLKIGILTNSLSLINDEKISKKKFIEKLTEDELDLVIGTHAVIQDKVQFKNLGLVLVDEQHRFGVGQRKTLLTKQQEFVPHFLSMTATPIPRSLMLTLYGDLDLSVIKELLPGRKPIITKLVEENKREQAYQFIRKQIKEGRQVFVICPLIDPSDKLGVKSVKEEYERLDKEVFPDLEIGLMHGKLKSVDKNQVMQDFLAKKQQILVSTSVIEVGIDVPNATIMMIEGAERFGLAQLHQFRGRVGRGQHQSYCLLFNTTTLSLPTKKRLEAFVKSTDGFKLAEHDLELRGPGEVYGSRQSGLPDLKIAKLTDLKVIQLAQQAAQEFFKKFKLTDFEELNKKLEQVKVSLHFE